MNRPILVIQTAFLGDLLLAGVLFREIRRSRPKAPIHLLCRKGFGTLVKALGFVDVIHEVKKADAQSYQQALQELRSQRFEWVLCPHPSPRSALFVQKIFAGQSVSFAKFWNWILFSKTLKFPHLLPDPLRQLSLLRPFVPSLDQKFQVWEKWDWNQPDPRGFLPEIPDELSLDCRSILGRHSPATPVAPRTWAIFPGSVWPTKQWTEKGFEELAMKLISENIHILWMGGKDEADICQRLQQKVPRSRSIAGQTDLWEGLVILSRCEGAIANDSGGQHLAAIAGLPVLSLFGPTTLNFGFRAWTKWAVVAERTDLFCRPCGPHGQTRCPRGTHECMTGLTSAFVFQRWQDLNRQIRRQILP